MSHVSKPLKFKRVDNYKFKNVLVIGCTGQGKSTLLNKLNFFGDPTIERLSKSDPFKACTQLKPVT